MDVYQFINSRDIRAYLRETGYVFSSTEAAWLIWQSKDTSIEERHAAWQELIETMRDCSIEERHNTRPQQSLHAYLRKLMDTENKYLQAFCQQSDKAVYQVRLRFADGNYEDYRDHGLYADVDACLRAIEKIDENEVYCIEISKKRFDGDPLTIVVEMAADKTVRTVTVDTALPDEDYNTLHRSFGGLWFNFPVPFKKGDILQTCREIGDGKGFCSGPFVMTNITPFIDDGAHERRNTGLDNSDMNAWGCFQDSQTGAIYCESMWCYTDLEYYRGELDGRKRVLKALSNYIKGEIDICLYSNAYQTILTEELAKDLLPCDYTEEGITLAGLK